MEDYIYLFIYKCPFGYKETEILKERDDYIKTVNSLERNDSYFAWRLLEKAVRRVFRKELNDCNPRKLESGKWICDGFHFSISHSGGLVAVALSNKNIGIDLQKERDLDFVGDGRFCDDEVVMLTSGTISNPYDIWTRKEALYKWLDNKRPFNRETWKDYNTTAYSNFFITKNFEAQGSFYGNFYFISVCSEIVHTKIKVVSNIENLEDLF